MLCSHSSIISTTGLNPVTDLNTATQHRLQIDTTLSDKAYLDRYGTSITPASSLQDPEVVGERHQQTKGSKRETVSVCSANGTARTDFTIEQTYQPLDAHSNTRHGGLSSPTNRDSSPNLQGERKGCQAHELFLALSFSVCKQNSSVDL